MRAVYIVGAPGVGKSTVVRNLINKLGYVVLTEPQLIGEKLLWGSVLHDYNDITHFPGYVLGKPHADFPGTDRLSMEVSPEAIRWAENTDCPFVIGEGSRLGTKKFLTVLASHSDLLVVHLSAAWDELNARCDGRGSNQKESFRRGAASGARSAADAAELAGARVLDLNTTDMTPEQVADAIYMVL